MKHFLLKVLVEFWNKFKKYLRRKWPIVNDLLFNSTDKYEFLRTVLGFFYGILISSLFWYNIICNLGLSTTISFGCLYLLLIFLGKRKECKLGVEK